MTTLIGKLALTLALAMASGLACADIYVVVNAANSLKP